MDTQKVLFWTNNLCSSVQRLGILVKLLMQFMIDCLLVYNGKGIALHGNPISELRDVTCYMGSHSVTCHPIQVNVPRLTPAMQAGTRFTYPGGMEGWVDLVDLIAPRPGVKPATFRSRVLRRTTAPPRQPHKMHIECSVNCIIVCCIL